MLLAFRDTALESLQVHRKLLAKSLYLTMYYLSVADLHFLFRSKHYNWKFWFCWTFHRSSTTGEFA